MTDSKLTMQELETYLWNAAINLRNKMDAGDYKVYIFPLLFYKRICDVYDEEYNNALIESKGKEDYATSQFVHNFQIPDGTHWNDLRNTSKNIGEKLQKNLRSIEKINKKRLYGIFGDAEWANKDMLSDETLKNLIEDFSSINLSTKIVSDDLMGTGYEYLIKQFADDSGHTAAEFYTNRTVVTLMSQILAPQESDTIYDPTCGSGGMLLEAVNFVKREGNPMTLKLYGQEKNVTTSGIARMNLLLHGFQDAEVKRGDTLDTPLFLDENGGLKKFDVILANPPYSISKWNQSGWSQDPYGRNMLGTPPKGNADYAFIQHILASLSDNGRAGILLPHGVLFRDMENKIRENLVESDKLEAVIGLGPDLFYNASMESCIMILNQNKKNKEKVLFIDALDQVKRLGNKNYLSENNLKEIFDTYSNFKTKKGISYLATKKEIIKNGNLLRISLYIKNNSLEKISTIHDSIDDWKKSRDDLIKSLDDPFKDMGVIKNE
jgi:type I restriction enzyme M protein